MLLKRNRPVGITLLALLYFFIAFTQVISNPIIGISSYADYWQQFTARFFHSAELLKVTSYVFPPLTYLYYGAHAVIGFGLWKLKEWSRIAVLVLIAFGCAIGVLFERSSDMSASFAHSAAVAWMLSYARWVLPLLWTAWYLTRPRVRFAFGVWPSIARNDTTTELPSGLSKTGKLWVYAAAAASIAIFICSML
jgi:uncharacterized membrane protein